MNKKYIASLIAVSALGAFSQLRAEDTSTRAQLPDGFVAKELNDQEDERSVLAAAINAAVSKGGFDDFVERLSTADRKRVGELADEEFEEMNGRIEQIRKNWKDKYGSDFNADDQKLLDGFVSIREGEVSDPDTARMNWPVPAVTKNASNASSSVNEGHHRSNSNSKDPNDSLEKGRNVAIVFIPASRDVPSLSVSMIHESVDDWRIDVPDSVSGDQIRQTLQTALTKLGDNVAAWPANVNDAYRLFGHTILLSVYGVSTEMHTKETADTK